MNIEIIKKPASSAAKIKFDPGDRITAEGGSMIAMSSSLDVKTTTHKNNSGNVLKAMARTLAGEGIFLNHYTASEEGELYLAPVLVGDMEVLTLDGSKSVIVQNGSFLAHTQNINMSISWQGFKNVFSGENMIWLKMSGTGKIIINAFGAIYPVDVDGEYIVDTGNIAAYEDTLSFKISKAGKSVVSSFLGGEGLVCKFNGKGRLWCQTHVDRIFGRNLTPYLVPKEN